MYLDKIYTSNFNSVDKFVMINRQVSISLGTPKTFKGDFFSKLAPTPELLDDYKNGLVTHDKYEEIYYRDVLSKLNPLEVYNALKGKVLCCWERKGIFCHRHLVMQWLKETLGEQVVGGEL